MPFNNSSHRDTSYYHNPYIDAPSPQATAVLVPSLDLTSLTMDDEREAGPKEPRKGVCYQQSNHYKTTAVPRESNGGRDVLFKKQTMPFVFPSEKSFTDIDGIRGKQRTTTTTTTCQNDDPYYITSVSSYRNNELSPGKEQMMNSLDDDTISFSLSNPKFGPFVVDGSTAATKADRTEVVVDIPTDKSTKPTKTTAFATGNKPSAVFQSHNNNAVEGSLPLQAYEVIVVNGHFKNDTHDDKETTENEWPNVDFQEQNLKDKPKAKVTFSFEETEAPSGRYTPIRPDVRVRLQSVLKKRKTPSPVLQRSHSEDRAGSYYKQSPIPNKDSIRLFGSSYTLDYRFGCQQTGLEHGIPVKHVHTTNADLENRHGISSTSNNFEKPPVTTANRITLSMAEKVATSGSVRGMSSRTNRLSGSHMRGRMAYFRPSDRGRTTALHNSRSRSSDDLHYSQNRSNNNNIQSSSTTTNKNTKTSSSTSTLPFSLRRCASSERDLLTVDENKRQRSTKPKIAFGSFILPKDSSTRVKAAQVQFHELNPASGGIPIGTYVHTHTRRSPYAAPTQVLLTEPSSRSEAARQSCPGTDHQQTRQLKQQHKQQQHQHHHNHNNLSSKNHAQRHSAPSSYNTNHIRETRTAPQFERISINTSPSKSYYSRATDEIVASVKNMNHNVPVASLAKGSGDKNAVNSGYTVHKNNSHANSKPSRKTTMAELNAIANKDRGISHHIFESKLEAYTKQGC